MNRLSTRFPISETFRRDFLMALGIWLALASVAFGVFPLFGFIQPGPRLQNWILISLLLGILGALLLAVCPRLIERDRHRPKKLERWSFLLLWRLLAWVGLAGLALPLLMLSYELLALLFDQLIEG